MAPATSFFRARSQQILTLLSLIFLLTGCAGDRYNLIIPPSRPILYDDGDLISLKQCLDSQLHYLAHFQEDALLLDDQAQASTRQLKESLETLKDIIELEPSPLEFDRILAENFTVYQAAGRPGNTANRMLVTGYFEPILQGSLQKTPPYIYPIYRSPDDLKKRNEAGKQKVARLTAEGSLVPYWTREEIETDDILAGNELVYLNNPFDAFLLHVQGSGKVMLRDGSIRSLRFAGSNGHAYSSIGKLLVDQGKIKLADASIPTIRGYLDNHPDELQQTLFHNHRYIFFQWDETGIVRGASHEPLTPGRSIAIDPQSFPMGTIGYLVSRLPQIDDGGTIIGWSLMQRFVFPQDSGSAIKGPGRVDLFMGNGLYAEKAAGAMKESGKLFFLVKNDFELFEEEND